MKYIDAHRAEAVAFLQKMISLESTFVDQGVYGNEGNAQVWLEKQVREWNFETSRLSRITGRFPHGRTTTQDIIMTADLIWLQSRAEPVEGVLSCSTDTLIPFHWMTLRNGPTHRFLRRNQKEKSMAEAPAT